MPDYEFRWITVDFQPIIDLRHRLLPSSERITNLAQSALDYSWMDAVDSSNGVFITAEGLLMYLQPDEAMGLITECASRFPGGQMIFDLPPVLVKKLAPKGMRVLQALPCPADAVQPVCQSNWPTWPIPCPVSGRCTICPCPRAEASSFKKLFPAFWQWKLTKQIRGAYTLLEFG